MSTAVPSRYTRFPSGEPAPLGVTHRFVEMGCTELTVFDNFRETPTESMLAPSGLAATFPATTKFVRDPFVGLPLAFGVSVFGARVPSDWDTEMPESEKQRAKSAVNRLVADESPRAPRWNESVDANWSAGLGRGGHVGLYKHFGKDQDTPEWFVVVAAGPDDHTLEEFEAHMGRMQEDPSVTFATAVSSFRTLESVGERLRARLAASFARAVGVQLASPRAGMEPLASSHETMEEAADEAVVAAVQPWLGFDVPSEYRVPRRAPRFAEDGFPTAQAGQVVRGRARTVEHGHALWSVVWNTLRDGEATTTVLYSDCVRVDPATTPFVPLLSDPKTFVAYAVNKFDAPCVVAVLGVPTHREVSDRTVAFCSDANVECRRTYVPALSVLRGAVEKCNLHQRMTMHAALVRVANRDYAGVVVAADGSRVEPPPAATEQERLEAQVRAYFFAARDGYLPPA